MIGLFPADGLTQGQITFQLQSNHAGVNLELDWD